MVCFVVAVGKNKKRRQNILEFPHQQTQKMLRRLAKRCYATKTIALIPGDGIGKEVVPEAARVIQAALALQNAKLQQKNEIKFVHLDAGFETFVRTKNALPEQTVQVLKTQCQGALFGAVSSPSHKVEGYSSPIVGMRNKLDLYANLRPCVSSGVGQSRPNVDMLIVRENTECLYVKRERLLDNGETAIADRVITKKASTRIAEMAYEQALIRASLNPKRQPRVTIVHKSNVLSVTDGLFRESALAVAKKYPQVQTEEQLVDSMVYKMILNPELYDVVVAPNLYGDILSDAAAALVGGLGMYINYKNANTFFFQVLHLVPMLVAILSCTLFFQHVTFIRAEPVHGSAPDIEGKNIANPIATIRAAAMLIQRLHEQEPAAQFGAVAKAMEMACQQVLSNPATRTPDLGGKSTTKQVTDAVIEKLKSAF